MAAMSTMSITEVRNNLAEIVRGLAVDRKPVGITVNGRTQAVLNPLNAASGDVGQWFQAASALPTGSLPTPFADHAADDGDIGACLWVHAASGAMIAAIPTGRWDRPGARFALYYSHPALPSAVHLDDWTRSLSPWEHHDPNGYKQCRAEVIELLRGRISGDTTEGTR